MIMNKITNCHPSHDELDDFINAFTESNFDEMSDEELKEYFEDNEADIVINQYKSYEL